MSDPLESLFSEISGEEIEGVELLAENSYCRIYKALRNGEPVIFKQYTAGDERLVHLEAEGIGVYHSLASKEPRLIDSEVFAFSGPERVVGITFVSGVRLADHLYKVANRREVWEKAGGQMATLGRFLAALRQKTLLVDQPLDEFHYKYLRYCTARLRSLPLAGPTLFRGVFKDLETILDLPRRCSLTPSVAHGDFVFRNIHVHRGRIGIIDFANTLRASHPLNDILNMWFALQNMWLPGALRTLLWEKFREGYGPHDFSLEAERFFHEYHRRRWLMLNMGARDPRRWVGTLRGLATFARSHAGFQERIMP